MSNGLVAEGLCLGNNVFDIIVIYLCNRACYITILIHIFGLILCGTCIAMIHCLAFGY